MKVRNAVEKTCIFLREYSNHPTLTVGRNVGLKGILNKGSGGNEKDVLLETEGNGILIIEWQKA